MNRRLINIADVRAEAKRRLPAPIFHYIDGGSDDEVTLRANCRDFEKIALLPTALQDVADIDLSVSLFGERLDLPFFLSPTGMSRLFHHEKEIGVARAAEKFGTLYSLSTMGTTSIEEIARAIASPKMFQIYILKDRGLTLEFMDRAKEQNYSSICLTVDMSMAGNRERDLRTGMTMPPRFGVRSLWSFLSHPRWSANLLLHPGFELANVAHRVDALAGRTMGLIDYVNSQFDRSVTWDDVAWLRQQWDGKLVLKGILTPDDATCAQQLGVDAVMISNHGGRQLDGAPPPIRQLQAIRQQVGNELELVVDGGIHRGTDIVKAIALGADACSIGKAYLYGLAAGGQAGVELVLKFLRDEVHRTLTLLGCSKISDLHEGYTQCSG